MTSRRGRSQTTSTGTTCGFHAPQTTRSKEFLLLHHIELSKHKGREMSVLLDRLDPVEERRVDQAEDGEAAAHDGAELREEAAEALALLAVDDAVGRDVIREDGVWHLVRVRVRVRVGVRAGVRVRVRVGVRVGVGVRVRVS